MKVLATTVSAAPISDDSALISAQQLDAIMRQEPDWLLIDVRPRVNFTLGHIPRAHNLWRPDYEADAGEYPFSGMRASREKMEKLLSRLGVTADTLLVLYDDFDNKDSARLWWILRLYGHRRVVLLDGGLHSWKQQKYPVKLVSQHTRNSSEYRFNKEQARPEWLADFAQVKEASENQDKVILLDVRDEDEVTGKKKKSGAFRKGRIPQSLWLDYRMALDDHGFLSSSRLKQLFDRQDVTADHKIITYCQSGVRSANTLFALTQILHYPNVSNYDGSWIEWSWHTELPVDTGQPVTR